MTACEEKNRLTSEYQTATKTFSKSVTELQKKAGVLSKDEYDGFNGLRKNGAFIRNSAVLRSNSTLPCTAVKSTAAVGYGHWRERERIVLWIVPSMAHNRAPKQPRPNESCRTRAQPVNGPKQLDVLERPPYATGMQIYLFASRSHSSISAFTSDETAGNLPADYAPWFPVNAGRAIPVGSPSDHIAAAVQKDGFFLLAARAHNAGHP